MAEIPTTPIYFAIRTPDDTTALIDIYLGVSGILAPLLAAVFGGWLVGHGYRRC